MSYRGYYDFCRGDFFYLSYVMVVETNSLLNCGTIVSFISKSPSFLQNMKQFSSSSSSTHANTHSGHTAHSHSIVAAASSPPNGNNRSGGLCCCLKRGNNSRSSSRAAAAAASSSSHCCGHLSSSRIFLLQSVVIWIVLCWPSNIVTLVLFSSSSYKTEQGIVRY